jgi:glycosyltransferase involved in cell wall biosynthesis
VLPPENRASCYYLSALREFYSIDLLKKIGLVTCTSSYLKSVYNQCGYDFSITVIPPGIKPITPLRKMLEGPIRFGYVGGISPIKELDVLIQAFRSTRGNQELYILGRGTEEDIEDLKEKIDGDKRIRYHGPYEPKDLPGIFSSIEYSVFPSGYESFGLTARESLSAGVPIIVSSKGALFDLVRHKTLNGYIFINEYQLRDLIEELSKKSRTDTTVEIEEPCSISEDAPNWLEIYESML